MITSLRPIWLDQDVFILGGGPSLAQFDLARLRNRHTIGCNDAYLFGPKIVDIVVFGDLQWWEKHKERLVQFPRPIVTNHPTVHHPRLSKMRRYNTDWHTDGLGWNRNTGSLAINLALILGAKRIFLIGFDMKLIEGKSNWHVNDLSSPTEAHYRAYMDGMDRCLQSLSKKWPHVQVINLNPESQMDTFPKHTWEEIFGA